MPRRMAEEEMKRTKEVFELLLCPPPGLDTLVIRGYYGINFPNWMASAPSFLPNLKELELNNCFYCGILPPLGNLPNLEVLFINGARSVTTIGAEFLGQKAPAAASSSSSSTCSVMFPKLTRLTFIDMPNWEKWEWEEEEEQEKSKKNVASMSVLPRLIQMNLFYCPKLGSLPMSLAQNATSLTKMEIAYCGSLTQINGFPFLEELAIQRCPNLESILGLPSLQQLELEDYEIERLPELLLVGGQQFPALQKLQIWSRISLLRRCLEEGSPDWSKIQHFPRVYGFSRNRVKYFSYTRNGGSIPPTFNTNILDA